MKQKAIIKWPGGKSKAVSFIEEQIQGIKYERWVDLFCGSLAIPLVLNPDKLLINDINNVLIQLYKEIADDPENLLEMLEKYNKEKYNNKEKYEELRDRFNEIKNREYTTEHGTLFIYLNKRCFSGLYRENQNGGFNVPFRAYKANIFNSDEIWALHKFFNEREVKFRHRDYKRLLESLTKNDIVYVDPPYYQISKTSFTQYHSSGFGIDEQEELRDFLVELDRRGIKFLMSNAPCDEIDMLYSGFHIVKYSLSRSMRSAKGKSSTGNGENECLVANFPLLNSVGKCPEKESLSSLNDNLERINEEIKKLKRKRDKIINRISDMKGETDL